MEEPTDEQNRARILALPFDHVLFRVMFGTYMDPLHLVHPVRLDDSIARLDAMHHVPWTDESVTRMRRITDAAIVKRRLSQILSSKTDYPSAHQG